VTQSSESDQSNLFTDTAEDQQTLINKQAGERCLFENEESGDYRIIARLQGFPRKEYSRTNDEDNSSDSYSANNGDT